MGSDVKKVQRKRNRKTDKMKLSINEVWGQVYLLPFIKFTHTRQLNGDIELIIGYLKWEIVIGI